MKKITLLFALMALVVLSSQAQNLQLHYDFGRNIYPDEQPNRQKVTLTIEQFKADNWGSWFYFVDIDFNRKETMSAYAEISREFNLSASSPFAAHIEYNGGLMSGLGSFQQSALVGAAYNGHSADFSKTWALQLLYKHYFLDANGNSAYPSLQLTGVWSTTFAANKCTFSGFIDFWRGEQANGHGQLVVIAEPQFWYNATSHLSIGTEWEISNNFVFNPANDKTFFLNPTLALKWNL